MNSQLNLERCRRLADQAIDSLALDLSGLTVLTEAATGLFAITAPLAVLAGAQRVLVLARDGQYGDRDAAIEQTLTVAERWNCQKAIKALASRSDKLLGECDVVTNLRAVRPIDKDLLKQLKSTAVIPLMFETWEFRPEDLDLLECRKRGIMVLGTNEEHPKVDVMSYLGPVAVKLMMQSELEVYAAKLAVMGSGKFANVVTDTLHRLGGRVVEVPVDANGEYDATTLLSGAPDLDALIVCEHRSRKQLIGVKSAMSAAQLVKLNPGLVVLHICGNIDAGDLRQKGLVTLPEIIAAPGYMSVSTAFAGPTPLINLHTAGLKVGEIMARQRLLGLDPRAAEQECLKHPLCQGFTDTALEFC